MDKSQMHYAKLNELKKKDCKPQNLLEVEFTLNSKIAEIL